uniref:Ig-like domain-containing protein n=1 Tax=Mastacembelus armatus TaxID=205130 RepID=A0A3Q3LM61_9TELE
QQMNAVLCLFLCSSGLTNITAEPGDTVTLTCRAPSSSEIRVIEWTRPDLKTDYVFVYRKKRFDPDSQHPSFKERVELKDSQMKDGDVSVTLKNVTFTDNGTYECRVAQGQTDPLKHISTIHLRVSAGECVFGGGDQGGPVGLAVGLTVVGILLLVAAVVGFMFYRKHQSQRSKEQVSVQQPVDGETVQHLL